jgi:uncharacterized membrane protein
MPVKTLSASKRLWFYRGLGLLLTTVFVHVLAVWATPRAIMWIVMHGPSSQALNMYNQAAFPPPVDAKSRGIVLPSPDLLYSLCVFDVSKGPVRVTADPQLKSYWSIALYGANSDNFFVINDRAAGTRPVDLWLVSPKGNAPSPAVPPGSRVIVVPSSSGLLLMRVLTGNYEVEKTVIEPARRTLACTPIKD